MRAADVDILLVPGWTGAGPDHWMTRWQARLKTSQRVEQDDWDVVTKAAWTSRLLERVALATRPVLLVAHSCGVPTIVHAAPRFAATKANIIGAMLVAAPSESACADLPNMDPAFAVYPRDPLPFPSLLVASRNDVFCSHEDAGDLALAWGSELVDAGESGHLNTESGHGPWPEGVMRMASFLQRLPAPQ
jgi:uncharacterized protein